MHTVDVPNTIITHDAGSPRDQLSPFWAVTTPLSYIGWGKTTQLGYGLGLAMGAKLAQPDKLCINVWGDAAIGMTGMDFETAVRERIPILSILLNNFSMAIELPGDDDLDREVPLDRHLRQLRRLRQGPRRLRRARHDAGRDRPGDQARHRSRHETGGRRCSSSSPRRRLRFRPGLRRSEFGTSNRRAKVAPLLWGVVGQIVVCWCPYGVPGGDIALPL